MREEVFRICRFTEPPFSPDSNIQHWSERGSVFILSDLHLDDDDCLLMDPDWIPPEEQIWIINNMVTKSDTFICLGKGLECSLQKLMTVLMKKDVTQWYDEEKRGAPHPGLQEPSLFLIQSSSTP